MATDEVGSQDQPQPLPRGAWRAEIDMRVRELCNRLRAAEAAAQQEASTTQQQAPTNQQPQQEASTAQQLQVTTNAAIVTVDVQDLAPPPPPQISSAVLKAHVDAARGALRRASEAIGDGDWRERLRNWWTGAAVTAGWESVHDAEAELVEIESEADVRASLPRLLAWLQQVMPAGDQRSRYEGALSEFMKAGQPLDRTTVRQAYQDVIRANSESKANLRAFRNLLTIVTVALALLLAALAIWHAIDPHFVSLCGPKSASGQANANRCVSGSAPHGQNVFEIELLGAIGGLLSLAVAFSATEAPPSRYNVRPQQAALKVVAGAATGLIGVLIVQSGIVVAPASQTSSEALFLVYAAVFGFSQQLFTRFVDKRANALLGEEESKGGSQASSAAAHSS